MVRGVQHTGKRSSDQVAWVRNQLVQIRLGEHYEAGRSMKARVRQTQTGEFGSGDSGRGTSGQETSGG